MSNLNNYKIQCSDLTNTIYMGRVNKDGTKWLDKKDVTEECIREVRNHMLEKVESAKASKYSIIWTTIDGREVELKLEVRESESENEE